VTIRRPLPYSVLHAYSGVQVYIERESARARERGREEGGGVEREREREGKRESGKEGQRERERERGHTHTHTHTHTQVEYAVFGVWMPEEALVEVLVDGLMVQRTSGIPRSRSLLLV
jgi:hypothetical protein